MIMVISLADVLGKCTRRLALIVNKNAKFHLSPAETDPSTVRGAFQSVKIADVKKILRPEQQPDAPDRISFTQDGISDWGGVGVEGARHYLSL